MQKGEHSLDLDIEISLGPEDRAGANTPELPPSRLRVFRSQVRSNLKQVHDDAIALHQSDPQAAGHSFEQVVANDLNAAELQQSFGRPGSTVGNRTVEGRRMDFGNRHEATLEGWNKGFGTTKLKQIWLDLIDLGQVQLTVPKLSAAARSQLARLGAQAESALGREVLIIVRETLP